MSFPLVEKRVKFSTSSAAIFSGEKLSYAPSVWKGCLGNARWEREDQACVRFVRGSDRGIHRELFRENWSDVHALTFSGGIGEKSGDLTKVVIDGVACLGFQLDDALGSTDGDGAVTRLGPNVLLIKTNEEVCAGLISCGDWLWFHQCHSSSSSRWRRSVRRINAVFLCRYSSAQRNKLELTHTHLI